MCIKKDSSDRDSAILNVELILAPNVMVTWSGGTAVISRADRMDRVMDTDDASVLTLLHEFAVAASIASIVRKLPQEDFDDTMAVVDELRSNEFLIEPEEISLVFDEFAEKIDFRKI